MGKRVLFVLSSESPSADDLDIIKRDGLEPVFVSSAEDALTVLQRQEIDIVVAELSLPGMPGDHLCKQIRQNGMNVHVILACSDRKSDLKLCGLSGADAHASIPIDYSALSRRISAMLRIPTRRATRVLVKVKMDSTLRQDTFYSVSQNISITGMMLEAEKVLARDDRITCSFFLPDSERLVLTCRVVRIEKGQGKNQNYGVEFVNMSPESKSLIEKFIISEKEAGNFY